MTVVAEDNSVKCRQDARQGWLRVPLGGLCIETKSGFATGERADGGVIQVRMNNVDTGGHFVWLSLTRVPADFATISQYCLSDGDVLFNNTNSTALVGKSALFESYPEPVVFSNHFTRLRTDPVRLLPNYLAWWLNHEWRRGTFAEICNQWIGQSAVKPARLLALEIPLPPLSEQARIASDLTQALAAADAARRTALDRLAAAESLPAAYLREVFEGPEASDFVALPLREVCQLLPSKSIATAGDTEVRAITTACLAESGFLTGGVKTARMRASDVPQCLVRSGEVLVARSNTPELVGRVAVYRGEPSGVVASDLTIRVWPLDRINGDYLGAFLSYLYQTAYWRERAGGASGTMKKITREQLLAQEIPVPRDLSVVHQCDIANQLSRRLQAANSMIAKCREELAAIAALPASLLRAAFHGDS